MIEFIGTWTRDQDAIDPGARVRTVSVDNRLFTVHNVTGPGWSMTIRPAYADQPRFACSMAGWGDWTEVERKAREFLASH